MNPIIKTAEFLQSVTTWQRCPAPTLPEYAFIGRSNVGKSSLINMLVQNKRLAKTSSTPGKTQTINHFVINKSWYLVDLPGYGYASISKTMREKWQKMIHDYLRLRENLQLVFVLIDVRLEPQSKDLEFINQLGEMQIPFSLIFTKADKISHAKAQNNIVIFNQQLSEMWDELPAEFISSTENGSGRMEILDFIAQINEQFQTQQPIK